MVESVWWQEHGTSSYITSTLRKPGAMNVGRRLAFPLHPFLGKSSVLHHGRIRILFAFRMCFPTSISPIKMCPEVRFHSDAKLHQADNQD